MALAISRKRAAGKISWPDDDWLRKGSREEIIEPDLPIIDPHHHLWDQPGHRYLIHEFVDDIASGHKIVATVYLNCYVMYRADGPVEMRPVGEVEFAAGMAAMSDSGHYGPTRVAAGIVGAADLTLGDRVRPVLEAAIQAGGGRFRGIRLPAGWDADPTIGNFVPSPGLYDRDDVRAGLKCLQSLGLVFDANLYHPQLQDVAKLARALPDLPIVLNHMGSLLGYGRYSQNKGEVFENWRRSIREVANEPNVTMKLGGFLLRSVIPDYVSPAAVPPTSVEFARYWKPYIETCIDAFGTDRCMFQSNFPVEKMSVSYPVLWNAFKCLTASFSPDEKRDLFMDTAKGFYRLKV